VSSYVVKRPNGEWVVQLQLPACQVAVHGVSGGHAGEYLVACAEVRAVCPSIVRSTLRATRVQVELGATGGRPHAIYAAPAGAREPQVCITAAGEVEPIEPRGGRGHFEAASSST
jgi:hypothetical protein